MLEADHIWSPDDQWTVQKGGLCRGSRGCPNEAVAYRHRWHHRWGSRYRSGNVVYRYCSEHLYGGQIRDGQVWIQVHQDSPMAREYQGRCT
jgi:hypothetical protein